MREEDFNNMIYLISLSCFGICSIAT